MNKKGELILRKIIVASIGLIVAVLVIAGFVAGPEAALTNTISVFKNLVFPPSDDGDETPPIGDGAVESRFKDAITAFAGNLEQGKNQADGCLISYSTAGDSLGEIDRSDWTEKGGYYKIAFTPLTNALEIVLLSQGEYEIKDFSTTVSNLKTCIIDLDTGNIIGDNLAMVDFGDGGDISRLALYDGLSYAGDEYHVNKEFFYKNSPDEICFIKDEKNLPDGSRDLVPCDDEDPYLENARSAISDIRDKIEATRNDEGCIIRVGWSDNPQSIFKDGNTLQFKEVIINPNEKDMSLNYYSASGAKLLSDVTVSGVNPCVVVSEKDEFPNGENEVWCFYEKWFGGGCTDVEYKESNIFVKNAEGFINCGVENALGAVQFLEFEGKNHCVFYDSDYTENERVTLYKPDKEHVCLIATRDDLIGSGCSDGKNAEAVDNDCLRKNSIESAMPECVP